MSTNVADILALAQAKAAEAIKGASSGGVTKSADPEVEARKEQREKAKAARNAMIIQLYRDRNEDDKNIFDTIAANEEVGVSKQTVISVLTEAGEYTPRKRHTQEDFDKVKRYFLEDGLTSLQEVATQSGYDYSYVRNVAIKLGVNYESNRGKMDPEKIPAIVEQALALEEFAGVSILTIGQYVHNLRKEARGDVQEFNADGSPRKKRGRKSKAEKAAMEAAANGEDTAEV